MTISVLFEDDYYIAVNKEYNQLVVKDRFKQEKNILIDRVGEYLLQSGHGYDDKGRNIFPVHRLDRETTGIVLFAKTSQAHKELSILFEKQGVLKTYWTIIEKQELWDKCTLSLPIRRSEKKSERGRAFIDFKKGGSAITQFRVLDSNERHQLVEVTPQTGKLHQIRLHLAAVNSAILFDKKYAKNIDSKTNQQMLLHSKEVSFQHPFLQTKIEITASLPLDFRKYVTAIKQNKEVIS